MRRREFITLLGGAAAFRPFAACAQQPAMPVIGLLGAGSAVLFADRLAVFREGLGETGYAEGRDLTIEYRWAEGHYDRLPALVSDLVERRVSVIAAVGGTPVAQAAKSATATIPIVFQIGSDPIEDRLVASLSQPGGNVTGLTTMNVQLDPKRLDLLREFVPRAHKVALLINSSNSNTAKRQKVLEAAARALALEIQFLDANTPVGLDDAFAKFGRLGAGALLIHPDPFFNTRVEQLGALTLRHAVPTIYQYREFVAAGGLVSYHGDLAEAYRQAGVYTGRILKGEKPADLPVQQSTKFELIINRKTANALGLTIPLALLARADEVIE